MKSSSRFAIAWVLMGGLLATTAACGDPEPIDPPVDAGADAGGDTLDAGDLPDSGNLPDGGGEPDGGMELPAYCPTLPAADAPPVCPATPTEVAVTGDITGTTWTCDNVYRLTGNVFVTSGTLTISAGTRVIGDPTGALIVTPGARIDAQGHPSAPVVFTSSRPLGDRDRGQWGGIVLLGRAPLNVTGGTDNIEGIEASDTRGLYGGTDAAHDCGTMRYVRIEFAGRAISVDNELNGLTLGGCGSATEIEFVQMHRGTDDAFEMFGGSPNLRFVIASGMDDDGLDWDQGFQGTIQFAVVHRYSDSGSMDPNGIEADNLNGNNDATPRSNPTVFNLSVLTSDTTRPNQVGMVLRRGTYGTLGNVLVQGFPLGVDVRDAAGEAALGTDLTVESSIFFMNTADVTADSLEATAFMAAGAMNRFDTDPMITSVSQTAPNYVPAAGSPVLTGAANPPDGLDTNAAYVGAFAPGCPDWSAGWAAYPVD